MKTLYEGILDAGDIMKQSNKQVFGEWMERTFKGKYKTIRLKSGMYKVWGELILRGLNVKSFKAIPFKIASMEGNLYIEDCPNITNLEGLFDTTNISVKIKGNVNITSCKKLENLVGVPDWIEGELSIVDCPNLKSLEGAPSLVYDVTLMKNGKRWSEKAVRDKFKNVINVNCSEVEPDGEFITEAFSEPHLIKFFEWLNKEYHRMQKDGPSYNYYTSKKGDLYDIKKIALDGVIPGNIELSKLRPSDVKFFDNTRDKVTAIRSAINKAIKSCVGFVIVQNAATDSYEYVFGWDCRVINLKQWRYDNRLEARSWRGRHTYGEQWGIQGIMDLAGDAKGNRSDARYFIVVQANSADSSSRHALQKDRKTSREGMPYLIKPDFHALGYKTKEEQESYMQSYLSNIISSNRQRWKKMIIVLRAKKKSAEYDKVCEAAGKLFERFSKVITKFNIEKGSNGINKSTLNSAIRQLNFITEHLPDMVDYAHAIDNPGQYWPYNEPDYCAKNAEQMKDRIKESISIVDNFLKSLNL